MPLFDKRDYVSGAVTSVLGQSYPNLELIIVDDGSTDGSHEQVSANFNDRRLILVQQKNSGVASAQNHGIRLSKNEWVAFLDADDEWHQFHLEELCRIIKRFPESALIATNYLLGTSLRAGSASQTSSIIRIDYFREAARRAGIVFSSAAAARRKALIAVGGFPPVAAGEDLACWTALALQFPVAYSDRVTALYRVSTGGIMDQLQQRRTSRKLPRPVALTDVSPSVAYLVERSSMIGDQQTRESVEVYISSRIESCTRAELGAGNIQLAKQWAVLGQSYAGHFSPLVKILLKFPSWALRLASRMRDLLLKRQARVSKFSAPPGQTP